MLMLMFAVIAALVLWALGAPTISIVSMFVLTLAIMLLWRLIASFLTPHFPRLQMSDFDPDAGGNSVAFRAPKDPAAPLDGAVRLGRNVLRRAIDDTDPGMFADRSRPRNPHVLAG